MKRYLFFVLLLIFSFSLSINAQEKHRDAYINDSEKEWVEISHEKRASHMAKKYDLNKQQEKDLVNLFDKFEKERKDFKEKMRNNPQDKEKIHREYVQKKKQHEIELQKIIGKDKLKRIHKNKKERIYKKKHYKKYYKNKKKRAKRYSDRNRVDYLFLK